MSNLKYKHTAYTSAQWASLNPVIVENEIVIESDTKRTKIGNGISTYNELEYADANSVGNSLGSIKPTDAAPTPARNGNYTFSIGGNKPAWLTAEAGITTVKAGDGVAVVYTEPSSYSYTHVDTGSSIEQARSQSTSKVPSSKLVDDELNKIDIYNVTVKVPLTADQYYTFATAIAAVPIVHRKNGMIILFESAPKVWVKYQFLSSMAYNWLIQANSRYTYWTQLKETRYPFQRNSTFNGVDRDVYENGIIDVEIVGGNTNWRVGLFTLERNGTYGWYIRLAVYDENDNIVTNIGSGGIIATYANTTYIEPTPVNGRIIDTISFTMVYDATISSVKIIIDWSALVAGTEYGINSYKICGLDSKIFSSAKLTASKTEVTSPYTFLPQSEETVWARTNLFRLGNVKNAIINVSIYGVTDKTKRYGIELLQFGLTGSRSYLGICEYSSAGVKGVRVCLWDNVAYNHPALTNGKQIDTITLTQHNLSGISAIITIDWAKIATSGTGWTGTYWSSNAFKVTDGEFSYNTFKNGSAMSGNATTVFQIDGVNCQLITPTSYTQIGTKSKLLILMHGNGQSYTYAGSTNFKNYCKDHNIAIATTRGQDQTSAPFTSQASGWGNNIHMNRYLKLYAYLMSNYNLHTDVILSCASMGGLVAGHFAFTRPFPISLCLFAGPVPDLSYIFANGGSRKAAIRNSYGMAADGSQDVQLEEFIQGYDWFNMGLIDVSGTKYKTGFPRMYIYIGTGDSTFTTDFGGTAKYNEIVTAIRNAGGFIRYTEIAGVSHADDQCFDRMISDNVMSFELGI